MANITVITLLVLSITVVFVSSRPQQVLVATPRAQFANLPPIQASTRRAAEERPQPYEFSFSEADPERGDEITRTESRDANGVVRGSYSLKDKDGNVRVVDYVADPVNGFQAEVRSNEEGIISHRPANVVYTKN